MQYSRLSLFFYSLNKKAKFFFQRHRYQKITKDKIDYRKKLFFDNNRSIPSLKDKILFVTHSSSWKYVNNSKSKKADENIHLYESAYNIHTLRNSSYEKLCSKNKNIDIVIGFSLFISYLEKEDIIDNFIEKVLDSYMNNLQSNNDIELYKMLVSFESISKIHYQIIPNRYVTILNNIKEISGSSKIRFKIMDILGE